MNKPKDQKDYSLIGATFSSLTLLAYEPTRNGKTFGRFKCECGNEKAINLSNVRRGLTSSCGCKQGNKNKTHGMSKTKIYRIWLGMIARCHNPKNNGYGLYGARGVYVCKEWRESFETFYREMGDPPEGKSLDKDIIKPGNLCYCREFCMWATPKEQANARRRRYTSMKEEEIVLAARMREEGKTWPEVEQALPYCNTTMRKEIRQWEQRVI